MSHLDDDSKLPERILAQFKRVTGAPQNIAISYLEESSWQLSVWSTCPKDLLILLPITGSC